MAQEEDRIMDFPKARPETFFARREIARKAVKRRVYEEDQHWADVALASLLAQSLLEQDDSGFYKFKKLGSPA
jgi:hypothetical protein